MHVKLLTPGLNVEQFYTSNVTRQVSATYGAGLYGNIMSWHGAGMHIWGVC